MRVHHLIEEESRRGAELSRQQIAAGVLKSTSENLKLTTPAGYMESDGGVMVLLGLFDSWSSATEDIGNSRVNRELQSTPYEALLAYAYFCVDIFGSKIVRIGGREEERGFLSVQIDEAVRRCEMASEAWHFSRHPMVVGHSAGNVRGRDSALLKHYAEDHHVLHMHALASKLVPDWVESDEEQIPLQVIDPDALVEQLLICMNGGAGNERKVGEIIDVYINNLIKRFARYLISCGMPTENDYKRASQKISKYVPSRSERSVRAVIRQHFSEMHTDRLGRGVPT
ncbi:hypothetical protein [Ralstonia sp. GX3-BWBA]|uniref:hypothetical protein n=1 Tax=Ralstonia sp. GX3-BWBA TaxID=2219865 RepID=UPI0013A6DEA8|nr:hypothetical protein [Ralstonia sp. GX3-BWBA]